MEQVTRDAIEALVRKIVSEALMPSKVVDPSGVAAVKVPQVDVAPEDRLDTGKAGDIVYTKDLFSLEESPRLGCGLMVMEKTTFDWTLSYDEIDYIIEGTLSINIDGRTVTAGPGEIILIPKGSKIQFSVPDKARFLYFTYPADWQAQAAKEG